MIKKTGLLTLTTLLLLIKGSAQDLISDKASAGSFPIVSAAGATSLYVDKTDHTVVQKTVVLLQQDILAVSGKKPGIYHSVPKGKEIILIGTLGKSQWIDQLVRQNKLKVDSIRGKWEAYQMQVVAKPFPGYERALVIVGSDRRGTAYGALELSRQAGVSPWYWWADVPVPKRSVLYYTGGVKRDAPAVKYRGIFINDEAPALSGWSREKFGGFNHKFYEKVFELILRLKGNYLWPAMWGSAFNDDDTLNPVVADQYAIVMGTSHHEPLVRAHDEWRRYGSGKWNYDSNEVNLRAFWKKGIERMGTRENIVSIGMRGDGDEPMTQGTAIALLERIVRDQREIISKTTGKDASEIPQLWALYKEVQDYYDKGMRVPDDVTLLLCDDNWGNIRKLPKLNDKPHPGGYGIYYHFDYVGGPRNYKWLNTNNIARVWEQMHLAWEYGARQIWIVNVGDIKPMELPTSFFLDYAWNPTQWNEDNIRSYYTGWARHQFGAQHAQKIGELLRRYSQYSARRKPELLDANTYSLHNYDEWARLVNQWKDLLKEAEEVKNALPKSQHDAYYQVLLHPVKAFSNLHQLYHAVALNKWFASHKDVEANRWADSAKVYYVKDSLITKEYHQLGGGKWNHMMSQTHIGYTYWQQPSVNSMPAVEYVAREAAKESPWKIDAKIPSSQGMIPAGEKGPVFYEYDSHVSMEARHWIKAHNSGGVQWKVIPDIGRTGSGITTFPVTASVTLSAGSPHVEYHFYAYDSTKAQARLFFSPTLNFPAGEGLQFAVSVDGEEPKVITLNKEDNNGGVWNGWVANNIIIKTAELNITRPGKHVLRYWMISPGVVLQKLVVDFGNVKQSYLGPPETKGK
ncbi:MAG TPA: glycosyl hydrolase 115 family protein [Chitinophagaceae bacterium]